MHRIKLPAKGFTDDGDGYMSPITITRLDVAVGQQHEFSTELFVRGRAIIHGAEERFAGVTILREGRDEPDADLEYSGKPDAGTDIGLAVAIHLALDHCDEGPGPDRFSASAELARICDEDDDE